MPEPETQMNGEKVTAPDEAATSVAPAIESLTEIAVPFSQREHTLMLEAVDKIAEDWMSQLHTERLTSEELEKKVLERMAKLKGDLTQFFLLGNAVCSKVRRDHEFNEKLHTEIDRLAEEHAT